LPEIDGPTPLAAALEGVSATPPARRLCLSPEAEVSLDGALGDLRLGEPVTLLVGPEGGFDAAEMERIASAGFVLARLGDFVLRTEIAAIAALGAVLARPRQ
jgi:16S rRNA (uracil1498-N3)-methyltransferase